MDKMKKQMYLEIGLAVLIALVIGISGHTFEKKNRENEKLSQQAVLENEKASEQKLLENEDKSEKAVSEEVVADGQYLIMGESSVDTKQLVRWFESNGEIYPEEALAAGGAATIEEFCQIYIEEAAAEGVRAEVAFVQSMKETGWLQFGGDASIEQFNFAGLGTTGNGVPGNSFPDVRTGVRAQIQHLKAYATEEALLQECVDARYEYVAKGSAPYVQWLGQQENPQGVGWATDDNYGYSIVEMIEKLERL